MERMLWLSGIFFQILLHLFFQAVRNKAVIRTYLRNEVFYLQKNTLVSLLDSYTALGGIKKLLGPLEPQFASTGGLNNQSAKDSSPSATMLSAVGCFLTRSRAVFINTPFIIFKNSGKITKIRSCIWLSAAVRLFMELVPRLSESTQMGSRPLWHHQGQSMPQGNHISNHTRILSVRLVRRVSSQFLYPLGVKRIHLNQPYRFFPQIMKERFSVRPTRFKTNHDLFKVMVSEKKLINTMPKLIEAALQS